MLKLTPIEKVDANTFIREHHYAVIPAPIMKVALGLYHNDELVGVATWGYGTRPLHTIRKAFPGLTTIDYLELGRFCVLDVMPRNTETQFLRLCREHIKKQNPEVKVLWSWADGLRGKPGYVYQADNWRYGGYIKSEFYATEEGEVVHPRFLVTRYGSRRKAVWRGLGLQHVYGYQFRYCYFLCGHKLRKKLLRESPYPWGDPYPKVDSMLWWIDAGEGSRVTHQVPNLKGPVRFRHPAPSL